MNQIQHPSTRRKLAIGLGALGALLLILIALLFTVAVQYRMLEKAKQELVEQHQQELESLKAEHRSKIQAIKKQQQAQDLIIEQERADRALLNRADKALRIKLKQHNDETDHMDSAALLTELRSIRTENQIY